MSKLLDELDSLHDLLREETPAKLPEDAVSPTSSSASTNSSAPSTSSEKLIEELKAFYARQRQAAEAASLAEREAEMAGTAKADDAQQTHGDVPVLEDIVHEHDNGQIPLLDEVVEDGEFQMAIPVLDEVVDEQDFGAAPESDPPIAQEDLLALVDTLVERRLERLRHEITAQVLEELQAIYPGLEQDLPPS